MIDLLRTRRSVRKYTEQPIEAKKVEILKEAVLRSPSSKNSMAWEFIFCDDRNIIQKLAESKPSGAAPLSQAPLAIAVLSNESQTRAWVEDCSIATIILQLTAHSLGLGSCWIQICGRAHSEGKSSEDYIRELLHIPAEYRVLSLVSIGYPQRVPEGKAKEDLNFGKIHQNGF